MSYNVNAKGYYGEFGGAYIPEMLLHNIDELKENYIKIISDDGFHESPKALELENLMELVKLSLLR